MDPSSPKDSSLPSSAKRVHKPLPPFLYRLKKKYQAHVDKIRETFSQVKINIPLLDVIQQMPPSARFLTDPCTPKTATNASKNAFLASSANSIISHQILKKYKDPNWPTIFIVIGNHFIHRALINCRANVNLIHFTEYKRLG